MATKLTNRKDELRAIIRRANEELNDIERREVAPQLAALLGKCFVYRNSYGDGPEWPLYSKVVAIEDYCAVMFQFECPTDSEIRIDTGNYRFGLTPKLEDRGYKPITEAKFIEAWGALQKRIASMDAGRQAMKEQEQTNG